MNNQDKLKCRWCKVDMKYQWSDADDLGGIEEWVECPKCGRTLEIPEDISRAEVTHE